MKRPWVVFVILLAGGLAWWLASGPDGEAPEPSQTAPPEPTPAAEDPILAGRDGRKLAEADTPEPDDLQEPNAAGPTVVRDDRPRHVTGWVFEPDGSPAVGVGLQAMPDPWLGTGNWRNGVTQADGSFRIDDLDVGQAYRLRTNFDMKTPGSDRLRCYSEVFQPGAEDVRIVMTRGVYLEGRVRRADGREPVEAIVLARPLDERADLEGSGLVRVRPDGRYRLGPLPPGRYTVKASPRKLPRFGPSEKREVTAPDTRVDFELPVRGVIQGRLLGRPGRFRFDWIGAGGAGDREGIQHGSTERDGAFVVPSVPDRPGVVYFWFPDVHRFALLTGVRPGEDPIDVRLEQGVGIQGRVKLPAWAQAKRERYSLGRVYVRSLTHGFSRWDSVDSTGTFTVRGLPEGRYALRFVCLAWTQVTYPDEVEARAGDTGVVIPFGEVQR